MDPTLGDFITIAGSGPAPRARNSRKRPAPTPNKKRNSIENPSKRTRIVKISKKGTQDIPAWDTEETILEDLVFISRPLDHSNEAGNDTERLSCEENMSPWTHYTNCYRAESS